uniref:Uncharacterized protein n=1 Tax=Meloidogyne javanica TaxID=6303 RepID=A0A915ML74_MELJA
MQQNNSSSEKIDVDCEQNKEISVTKPVKLEKKTESKSSLDCQNKLFYSKDKFEENPSCVTVKIGLCNNCVKANSTATDVLAPYKKIGSKRKAE